MKIKRSSMQWTTVELTTKELRAIVLEHWEIPPQDETTPRVAADGNLERFTRIYVCNADLKAIKSHLLNGHDAITAVLCDYFDVPVTHRPVLRRISDENGKLIGASFTWTPGSVEHAEFEQPLDRKISMPSGIV